MFYTCTFLACHKKVGYMLLIIFSRIIFLVIISFILIHFLVILALRHNICVLQSTIKVKKNAFENQIASLSHNANEELNKINNHKNSSS